MKQRITILGGGESGTGAALLAKSKGFTVFVSDANPMKADYKNLLDDNNIPYEEDGHTENIYETDLVIKSPGIPYTAAPVRRFQELEVEIIDEIEFAFRNTSAKIIAVTGTNGKTTTALLTHFLLDYAGIETVLAGNVGKSFAKAVLEHNPDYFVVEVSSFQLEGIKTFKPHIAILLNITPDHLDRYEGSMEKYAATKMRIAMNMDEKDQFIYYLDDPQVKKNIHLIPELVQSKTVSLHDPRADVYYDDQKLIFNGQDFEVKIEDLAIKGPHNYINSMCAALTAMQTIASKKKIGKGLRKFVNAPHRMEKVTEIKEISFVNDSKATNVQSVKYALESFTESLIWIAGGLDKGNDYALISELVRRKVKVLICLGRNNEKLKEAFADIIDNVYETTVMQEAVQYAIGHADPGDVILLSPACASFDLYLSYEDRGNQFKNAVRKLEQELNS